MNFKALCIAAALTGLATTQVAQAALQTWRLEAIAINKYGSTFVPPTFLAPGTKVTIDYVIDVSTAIDPAQDVYQDALVSVTFNGETSTRASGHGYVLAWETLNAINAGYWNPRSNDGIDFISLNSFDPQSTGSLYDALLDISSNVSAGTAELRFDFGNLHSVFATPTSLTAVPEPSTSWLFIGALPVLAAIARKRATPQ